MDRRRLLLIAAGIAVAAFLLGFLPQWARANRNADRLAEARRELAVSRTEGKVAAALNETLRSNYERARQIMAEAYAEIDRHTATATAAQGRELQAILAQRDEIITLLARAAPESSQRLMLIHTRYRAAMEPGAGAATETPTPGS